MIYTDSLTLTINGRGFDATSAVSNSVHLNRPVGESISGTVYSSTTTTLVFSFEALSPTNSGKLKARLRVSGTWDFGTPVSVATIEPKPPSLLRSTAALSSDTTSVTLQGRGFEVSREASVSASCASAAWLGVGAWTGLDCATML